MHFFTDKDLTDKDSFSMTGDDAHHLLHVLRAGRGAVLEVTDGNGRTYSAVLKEANSDKAVLTVEKEIETDRELCCHITLYPCMTKSDKMAWIVQKATELGVSEIVPVVSARTVARPDAKSAEHKEKRWQKIAEAAAKQCGRTRIPVVRPIISIEKAIGMAAGDDLFLLPYECADDPENTRERMEQVRQCSRLSVMIGPEGGFAPSEVQAAEIQGAQIITLGKRILRAETAAVAVLSWLVYQLEI